MEQSYNQISQPQGFAPQYPAAPQSQPTQQGPAYNAVKIDIINPEVNAGTQASNPTGPYNVPVASAYPQYSPVYNYPQANAAAYPPPYIPQQAAQDTPQPAPAAAPVAPPPSTIDSQPSPEKKTAIASDSAPSAKPDAKAIAAGLESANPDEQAASIQKIAEVAQKDKEQSLAIMSDSEGQVYKDLSKIVLTDTSKIQGQDKAKADLNKEIGMWTMAILLKNFRETIDVDAQKQNVPPVSVSELGNLVMPIVKNVQADPNPEIRKGGILALAYIAKPEDYQTLSTALNLVIKQDKDKGVKDVAKKALEELPKPEKTQAPSDAKPHKAA